MCIRRFSPLKDLLEKTRKRVSGVYDTTVRKWRSGLMIKSGSHSIYYLNINNTSLHCWDRRTYFSINLCQYNNFLNCIPFICSLSLLSYSSSTLSSVSSSSAPMSSIFSPLILPSASSFSVFLLLFGLDSSQC